MNRQQSPECTGFSHIKPPNGHKLSHLLKHDTHKRAVPDRGVLQMPRPTGHAHLQPPLVARSRTPAASRITTVPSDASPASPDTCRSGRKPRRTKWAPCEVSRLLNLDSLPNSSSCTMFTALQADTQVQMHAAEEIKRWLSMHAGAGSSQGAHGTHLADPSITSTNPTAPLR